jgi:cobalt-zinc-cadmium efflux system outer membrane protein
MNTAMRVAMALAICLPSPALAQAELTLDDAVRRTLAAAPHGAAVAAHVDVLNARRAAAGLRPAPSVEVMAENFGPPIGDVYDQFQITGSYNQRIERGGKRAARVALADREIDVVEAEFLVQRLELIATVQRQFVRVQAAEAAIGLARRRLEIAQELHREVARRVASARDPIFAGTRAETGIAEAQVDLELAIHERDAALTRLSSLWGGSPADLTVSTAGFLDLAAVPGPLSPSPAVVAIYEARGSRADAATALERANAARDPTLSAGPRVFGNGDVGLIAGVSLPLGGRRLAETRVSEAEAERRRVDAELAVERFNLGRAIDLAAEQVEEARHEAEAIQQQVVPKAEQALKEVRFGYNRGFFSFADVVGAQSTLAEAAERTVAAARRYHEAQVELDRLTGRHANLAEEAIR